MPEIISLVNYGRMRAGKSLTVSTSMARTLVALGRAEYLNKSMASLNIEKQLPPPPPVRVPETIVEPAATLEPVVDAVGNTETVADVEQTPVVEEKPVLPPLPKAPAKAKKEDKK